MTLPNKSALLTVDYAFSGSPFVSVEAKTLNTYSLDYAFGGQPFFGVSGALPIYVNVSGSWKQADSAYVNVSGSWKQVSSISANISGTWE